MLMVLAALGTNAERRQLIMKHSFHSKERMAPTYVKSPCDFYECPEILEEVVLAPVPAVARKVAPRRYVVAQQDGQFQYDDKGPYMDAMMKLISYHDGENFMERKIPITAPIITRIKPRDPASATTTSTLAAMASFERKFEIGMMLPRSIEDDPYIAPTNTKLSVQTWSPCDSGSEWILVSTFNFNPDYPNPETPRLTFVDITRKVASALEKKGATKKFRAEWAYFVSYGSPIDRKYELWIPVSDEVISLLRSAA